MYDVYLFNMLFSWTTLFVSLADPDIGDIDGKQIVVNKTFIWL